MRLVVVAELPRTRDTLPLRLMGRGATAARAALDLAELPAGTWERRLIAPMMVSLHRRIARAESSDQLTEEEKEILVTGQKLIEAIETKGRQEGLQQGLQQGFEPMVHQFARRLGRPLTDRQRATLLRRLGTLGPDRIGDVVLDLDPPALAAWLANPRAR